MLRENVLTAWGARLASLPFRLFARRPPYIPRKALILKPCCLSQVMLTTPLLAALAQAFPQTRFDWAVSDWARPAITGNPHLSTLLSTGPGPLHSCTWSELGAFVQRVRDASYDTCIIPSRSSLLAYVAWRAHIPQRVGLHIDGRGFAHTLPVTPPTENQHETAVYLSLAHALGVPDEVTDQVGAEFFPSDSARKVITERLVALDWLGDVPLVVVHPGGGLNPAYTQPEKRWPRERFALLCSYLVRHHQARVILVGDEEDRSLTQDIEGLVTVSLVNLAGQLSLSELGALCEIADLYVGNDAGPTHVAAAVGCPTLAIYGPSDPALSRPYATKGEVVALWRQREGDQPFSWEDGISLQEAIDAAEPLIDRRKKS